MAVPADIAMTAPAPAASMFCERVKTSTSIAPEQGRSPAATTVANASRHWKPGPASVAGSGAWAWPQLGAVDVGRIVDRLADEAAGSAGGARAQGGGKAAPLCPYETRAEQRDGDIACDLDRLRGVRHLPGRRVEDERRDRDEGDGDQPLQQGGKGCKQQPALQLDLVGDHVGGEHRLAVAGAGGMEDAIGEACARQRKKGVRACFQRARGGLQLGVKLVLPGENQPGEAGRRAGGLLPADGEGMALRERRMEHEKQEGRGARRETPPTQGAHGQATMARVASFMPKSAPGDMFWKKASLSF